MVGFTFADRDQPGRIVGAASFVFEIFDQNFDSLADLGRIVLVPFVAIDRPFTFETDIDDNVIVINPDDRPFDDFRSTHTSVPAPLHRDNKAQ